MLLDFQVGNYRSFRTSAMLSLAASNYSKDLPGNLMGRSLPGLANQKFLKGIAIYGANASGKSNLVRALFELQRLVRNSHKTEDEEPLPHDPFQLDEDSSGEPTVYQIRFVADVRYHYSVAFDGERILEEALSAFPNGREQKWFHRTWNGEGEGYSYTPRNPDNFKLNLDQIEATKKNSLFLSVATNLYNHPQLKRAYGWFRDTLRVLNLSPDGGLNPGRTLGLLEKDSSGILNLLRHADLGINGLDLEKVAVPEEYLARLPEPVARQVKDKGLKKVTMQQQGHGGKTYPLTFEEQSAGTARYFELIGHWLDLMKGGIVLALDELETSLHPLLSRELVRLAMTSTSGSQVLLATHDPLLLDNTLLRRDQIYLTEKTPRGDTILYALNEYKTPPNNRESLVRGYLSGRYGGIPYIPASLVEENSAPR